MTYTVRVYHGYYGCDTGCCGHRFEISLGDKHIGERFEFDHFSKEDAIEHARDVVKKNWPECFESIDWDSIDISEAGGCGYD